MRLPGEHIIALLSPLVFTVTALGISLFQAQEMQYPSFERVKVSSIYQGLALNPQTSQLNNSLDSLVRLRSLRFTNRFQILISRPAVFRAVKATPNSD